jgi:hypothetical protein
VDWVARVVGPVNDTLECLLHMIRMVLYDQSLGIDVGGRIVLLVQYMGK